tara:strand:- start:1497 stop:2273 length:777 start_codon:yes stop_codon:yes gene_type:complete
MKIIILAGGWGTRLGRQTVDIPKPMVKIGRRPVLWHIMKIFSHYDYKDFIISCGVKSHVIKNYFANYQNINDDFMVDMKNNSIHYHSNYDKEDWRVNIIDTGLNTLKGARIKRLEKYLDSPVNIVTYGDGLADVDISKLVKFHHSHGKTVTITGVHPPARFGEIIEKKSKVVTFQEKPQTSVGLINGGFMVFNENLLDKLSNNENCDLEKGVLEDLSNEEEVMVFKHDGSWECMDHERDVTYLNNLWENNNAFWKVWK